MAALGKITIPLFARVGEAEINIGELSVDVEARFEQGKDGRPATYSLHIVSPESPEVVAREIASHIGGRF